LYKVGEKLLWKDKLIYLLKKVVREKPLTFREGVGGR
jgi:hypothetical protein